MSAGSANNAENGGGNLGAIVRFLAGKGLSNIAIAGAVGNLSVESGFDPTNPNAAEGANGIAQWEGGRIDALKQFAAAHGGNWSDLNIQLEFMWHELTTSYSDVLHDLRNATSVAQAATIWDSRYEISAGTTRQQRITNAEHWFNSGTLPTSTDAGGEGGNPAAGNNGGGGGGNDPMTRADYAAVDDLGGLLSKIPALKKLVNTALNKGWDANQFQNQVENSDWWKNHSQTTRAAIIERVNDPKTWQQDVQNAINSVQSLAHQTGLTGLTSDQIHAIAVHSILTGNQTDQQWLTDRLAHHEDYSNIGAKGLSDLGGAMAANVSQLQSMAADYGFNWTPEQLAGRAKQVVSGQQTLDAYDQHLKAWAASAFPAFRKDIMGGTTVKDLALPYLTSMSNILEVDPNGLSTYTPMIRNALQGSKDKTGDWQATSLTDFEKQLRSDPRWQYTSNAHQTISQGLLEVGNIFGFGPDSSG